MKVCVFGAGYVGLVTSACMAEMGNSVACVDIDSERVAGLNRGEIPIHEPGLSELVLRNAAAGRLHFTTDAASAVADGTIVFIAVGTPPAEDGSADLDHVLAAAASIGRHMRDYKVVVDKSTVPVGTADKVRATIAAELHRRGTVLPFAVVSNPEFLKEGAAIEDFMRPDRIVIGADDEQATLLMRALYSPFLRNRDRLLLMDVRSAELTKYVANAMLATRISFMNEMAALAERVAARFGEDLRGHTFALWGLAFKPDTDDMREAPSLAIIDALLSRGARVRAFDPAAMPKAAALMPEARGFELVDNPYAAAAGASALLVVTEWREFRSPDLTALRAALRTPVLFDGRNLYDPELLRSLGFEYHGIGRLGAGAKHERAEPRLQVVAA